VYSYKTLPRAFSVCKLIDRNTDSQKTLVAGAQVYQNKTDITAYSYDSAKREFVSYDTPSIVKMKALYAVNKGLAGTMFWEVCSKTLRLGLDALNQKRSPAVARQGRQRIPGLVVG
jgi:GH18 family chitinase